MRPADITVDDGGPDIAGAVALHPAVLCEDKALHPLAKVLNPTVSNGRFKQPSRHSERSSSFATVHANTRKVAGHSKMQAHVVQSLINACARLKFML